MIRIYEQDNDNYYRFSYTRQGWSPPRLDGGRSSAVQISNETDRLALFALCTPFDNSLYLHAKILLIGSIVAVAGEAMSVQPLVVSTGAKDAGGHLMCVFLVTASSRKLIPHRRDGTMIKYPTDIIVEAFLCNDRRVKGTPHGFSFLPNLMACVIRGANSRSCEVRTYLRCPYRSQLGVRTLR